MGKKKVVGVRINPLVEEEPENPWPGIFALMVLILILGAACGG